MLKKKLIEKRFSSHFKSYTQEAVVQKGVCKRISALLRDENLTPCNALEVGAGTGLLTKELLTLYPHSQWHINDLSEKSEPFLLETLECVKTSTSPNFIYGDAESIPLPESLDLFASASTVQWFDNLEAFISKLSIKSNGYIAISTFLEGTLKEINATTQSKGLNYPTKDEIIQYFTKNNYKITAIEDYEEILTFSHPIEVLRHLKNSGVNSISIERWTKSTLNCYCEKYFSQFSNGENVILTYKPLIIVAKRN